MSIFDPSLSEEKEKEQEAKRRLFDIHSEEISLVDRAANQRKYLVTKRNSTHKQGITDETNKSNKDGDAMKKDKKKAKQDLDWGNDPGFEDPTTQAIEKAKDLVDDIKEDYPDAFKEVEKAEIFKENEDEEVTLEMSSVVKEQLTGSLTNILENLTRALDAVKKAEATDSEDNILPDEIASSVYKFTEAFENISDKFTVSAEAPVLSENAKDRIINKLTGVLDNVMYVLEGTKDAEVEKDSKTLPENDARKLDKSVKDLNKILERYSTLEPRETEKQENEDEPEVDVEKAGKRISAKRLSDFKKIHEQFSSLIKELEGSVEETEESTQDPEAQAAPEAASAEVSAFMEQFAVFGKSMADIKETVDAQTKRIEKISGEPAKPNSTPVEKKGDADDEVSWPWDMNRRLDKTHVKKSTYMG